MKKVKEIDPRNRNHLKDLDAILNYFYKRNSNTPIYIKEVSDEVFQGNGKDVLLPQLLHKLNRDGYLLTETISSTSTVPFYTISLDGRFFFEKYSWIIFSNSPYLKQKISDNIKVLWNITKIIAAIIVSIANLLIGYWALSQN